MERQIRVLVVDDSTVIRRLLSDTLGGDREIAIAATAANGKIALAKIPHVNPDVVTLDMEMPEMDGIATLTELRKHYPDLPVIMFSTLTERGAAATFDALARGANDYVTKPANVGSVGEAIQNVRRELIPKIKSFCRWYAAAKRDQRKERIRNSVIPATRQSARAPWQGRVDIVAIGVSTGGPAALGTILPQLPADFPVPIVIVQHMPPIFTKHLADRLDQTSAISVREATERDELAPGVAYIAPGGYHMRLSRRGLSVNVVLNQDPPENSCRPAVDVLFRAVANLYGPNALGIVLTGMGRDGLLGGEAIRRKGGYLVAQDESSSVVWGMPGAVVDADLADRVLPLEQISDEMRYQMQRRNKQLATVGTK